RQGTYAQDITKLDVAIPVIQYFETTGISDSDATALQTHWSQTLTRKGASAGYGAYTVTFTEDGYDSENSTITDKQEINPMQTNTSGG
ncbi:MAG: hypothetical protein K8T90_12880, partial [Planctomycetes bacterium]|nr:hypothetical protein [Planctomycetota bacterium]